MAKITMADGSTFEGTISEWVALSKVAAAEAQPQDAPLKVGDYAKVVGGKQYIRGELVRLTDAGTAYDFRIEYVDKDDYDYIDAENLVKVTDEEVAAAQASVAEAERWDEIGRNVGELKKGDIVRVTKNLGAPFSVGSLYVVYQDSPANRARLENRGFEVKAELIAPVEDRFDRV